MSARDRREKRERPDPRPPRTEAKAAKRTADRLEFYDTTAGYLADLDNRDLAEMLGQLITHLNHRIERTRIQLLVDDHFGEAKTNFDRHEANLARLQRHQRHAVGLLKLIHDFDQEETLAAVLHAWIETLQPEEGR